MQVQRSLGREKVEEKVEEKKEDECVICMTDKSHFFTCIVCSNKHCWTCHEKLISPTCPFCRKHFDGEIREQKYDSESEIDSEIDDFSDEESFMSDEENDFDEEAMNAELLRLTAIHRRERSQLSRDLLNSMIWNSINYMADFMINNVRIPRRRRN